MKNQFYIINAFTKKEFKGNPAAIILLKESRSTQWMESFAKEVNQPITTFITKKDENSYHLRWFTPTQEIELCGHGTLGAAHILWSEGYSSLQSSITFDTPSGILRAERLENQISLSFPIKQSAPIEMTDTLKQVTNMPIKAAAWAEDRYILEVENEEMVHSVMPDLEAMKGLEGAGVVVTSRGSNKYDFVSRYFAPKIGVNEDYVTGSAHCALASYWSEQLHQTQFSAYQDSERGGEINVEVSGDTVKLAGDCLTLLKGEMNQ
jgi:PhzF family phenazine biosynthesis protein